MNKLAIALSVVALSMGFTACDNYELPNPPAQSNPQTAPFDVNNIAVAPLAGEDAPEVLDLKALNDADQMAPLGQITLENWPADYTLNLTMYMSADKSMADAKEVPCSVLDGVVYAAPDALQAAYTQITKNPAKAHLYVNYGAVASLTEGSTLYIGGPEYRFGAYELDMIPFPADVVIEDSYSINHNGNVIKLTHSSANQYDDPVFSAVIEITADEAAEGYEWILVPASGEPTFGGEGLKGDLVEGAAGKVDISGPTMFSFNMADRTFEIYTAYSVLYTPGVSNSWTQADSDVLYTSDYVNYHGWVNLDSEFKFCATLDWTTSWGANGKEGELALGSNDNIVVTAPGCYYATVNLTELTYTLLFIESCGVIGDATEGGWDAETRLTQDPANPMIWSAKINFKGEGAWKFRFNDNWDYNLGGDLADLSEGGDNIATPGEGEHTVTLNLSSYPYVCTIE